MTKKIIVIFTISLGLCSAFSFFANIGYFNSVPSVGDTLGSFVFDNVFFSFLVNCGLLVFIFILSQYLSLRFQKIGIVVLFYGCLQSTNFLVFQQYACQWQTCDTSLWQFHFIEHILWSFALLFIFWQALRRILIRAFV